MVSGVLDVHAWRRSVGRWTPGIGNSTMAVAVALGVAVLFAPPAVSESGSQLRAAVESVRGSGPCAALGYDPIVEEVAEIANRSIDDYMSQRARNAPVSDAIPVLKDLGSGAGKAVMLRGSALDESAAVKGVLLQGEGSGALSDCSYTDFGVSVLKNEDTGHSLAMVLLAGA